MQLGSFGVIITNLHPRKRILPGRINEKSHEFDNASKLSYEPKEYNTTYMRACTPNETMFYGSIVSEILGEGEPTTARITIIYEISEFAHDLESFREQIITFSVWEVQKEIRLFSLLHHKNFEKPTEFSKTLQVEFEKFIKKYNGKEEQTTKIAEFLVEQYSKIVSPEEDFDYLISARYS